MAASAAAPPWLHDADLAAQKHEEAVAVAVEKCADDTKGQTCYICLDDDAEEGLVRGCACRGAAGFVHVSCLAEQAKILVAEAEENNLGRKAWQERWARWHTCRLCEQGYHGVVACALGWACWKTYVGRPETDIARCLAMGQLGNGLSAAEHYEDALSVREAEVIMMRRVGVPEEKLLIELGNLAITYQALGRNEEALRMRQNVYSGCLNLHGEQNDATLRAANNYAVSLNGLERFEEAKSLLRRTMPVARRVLGTSDELTLQMRGCYAMTLYEDPDATLDDLREAVSKLEELERTAKRVLGGAHPLTTAMEDNLRQARAVLRAREEALAAIIYAAAAALAVAAVLVLRKKLT
jgi:tetratricopeptide (TPR) repeat protein